MNRPDTKHPDIEGLSAYLDAELDPGQTREVRKHLDRCENCQAGLQKLTQVKTLLAKQLHLPAAPHSLTMFAKNLLLRKTSPSWSWQSLTATAAALLVCLTGMLWMMDGRESPTAAMATPTLPMLVEDHLQHIDDSAPWQMEFSDAREFDTWMEARFLKKASLPDFHGEAVLLGGRFCSSFSRPTVQTFYNIQGERASLFIIRDDRAELKDVKTPSGVSACWRDGFYYALITNENNTAAQNMCNTL